MKILTHWAKWFAQVYAIVLFIKNNTRCHGLRTPLIGWIIQEIQDLNVKFIPYFCLLVFGMLSLQSFQFFQSFPSCLVKCKQNTLWPKVTKNEKWDERNSMQFQNWFLDLLSMIVQFEKNYLGTCSHRFPSVGLHTVLGMCLHFLTILPDG